MRHFWRFFNIVNGRAKALVIHYSFCCRVVIQLLSSKVLKSSKMSSSNQSKLHYGQAFCGLLILAAIIGGGFCFYNYANQATKEKVIHESTGPFVWTLTNEANFPAQLVISGGVSLIRIPDSGSHLFKIHQLQYFQIFLSFCKIPDQNGIRFRNSYFFTELEL